MRRLLLFLTLLLVASQAFCAEPTPKLKTPFQIVLTDSSTVQAMLLPGPNNTMLWIHTQGGKIVVGTLTFDEVGPTPPIDPPKPPIDPPKPPVDPPKPPTGKISTVIGITSGSSAGAVWKDAAVKSFLDSKGLKIYEFDTSLVENPQADPIAMKWIGLSAVRNTQYPYVFLATDDGSVLEASPSASASSFMALVNKHLTQKGGK